MSRPIFSVIVPVYNVEKYLRRCVDSILAQTFTDFELLLIDDGSTDDSGRICDEYAKADGRVRAIHKQNGGPSSSRNCGLQEAVGVWAVFVDSDDYVGKDYLALFFKYNPGQDVKTQVIMGATLFGEGEINNKKYHSDNYDYTVVERGKASLVLSKERLLDNWTVWGKLFSMDVIRKAGLDFNEKLKVCEDGLFWHSYICEMERLVFIEEREYYYYAPMGYLSISNSHKWSFSDFFTLAKSYKHLSLRLIDIFMPDEIYARRIYGWYISRYKKLLKMANLLTPEQLQLIRSIRPNKILFKQSWKDWVFALVNVMPFRLQVQFVKLVKSL